jgi:hypothetical protein
MPEINPPEVTLPVMVLNGYLGRQRYMKTVSFTPLTDDEVKQEKEHVVLELFYRVREEPSTEGLDEVEIESLYDNIESHLQCYRLRWDGEEGPLINAEEEKQSDPTKVFPNWMYSLCENLASYINGYLSDTRWRLEAYEIHAPGYDIIENIPVFETPMEQALQYRRKELLVKQKKYAFQTDFFGFSVPCVNISRT